MSSGWLFAVGALVTVLVAIGIALPIYGAILDGRYQAERKTAETTGSSNGRQTHNLERTTR
jgi:hypothetical protein